ncbi:MAG: VCBS repeat-containing protein [Betaproteobacteria bacterium]|nr:VCBS repeat-containing protein [Betaproteobacteria bacterium]
MRASRLPSLLLALVIGPALAQEASIGPAPWLDAARPELWIPGSQPKAAAIISPIATASKVAVRDAYNAYYAPAMPAMGFTGSIAGCTPGTISTAFKEWSITRVNYFRAMSGLPGNITLDTDATRESEQQAAAVLFAANANLSHAPANPPFATCPGLITSPSGYNAASKSNIAWASGSSAFDDVVPRYIDDNGAGNELLGHRRWILYPPQTSMAIGSTPSASGGGNALRVLETSLWGSRPATPNGVAWPSNGFVPIQVLPPSKRWSYSFNGANFSAATVSMAANGSPIGVTVISNNATGYGDNTIAFVPTPAIVKDTAYQVTVNGMTGAGVPASYTYTVRPFDPADPITGAYDFSRDGRPDLLWSNTANGATYIWNMNGTALASDQFMTQIDPSWKIQGIADFNGDGHMDVVWRNTATGSCYVWYLVDGVFQSDAFLFSLPPEWVIQGVADFNKDGKPDFLMRNVNSGNAFAWFFANASPVGDQFLFSIDPGWKVEGVGDFNADDQPDLLFRNMASGLSFAWNTQFSAGTLSLSTSSPPIYSIDPVWEVVQVADWNADGKPDLVFRNTATGLVFVWYLDGITLGGSAYVTQIDPSWELVPRR